MKRIYKILISFIFILLLMAFNEQNKVQAKSYYIDDMNIQAIVLENGDLEIEQTLKYTFNGSYNGIYITIPTKYKNKEEKISKISDDIYNAQGIELQKVSQLKNGEIVEFQKVNNASNGQIRVYTEELKSDIYKLKVFCPTENGSKTFKLNYILKNICVSHNDIGELYYNFIGGEWECTIKNLKIDIYLPNNQTELKIWGHGPDNGISEIVDNTHVRLKVNNVPTGKYVAGRVVFDKSNIPNAQKVSNIDAYNLIYEDEQQISKINDKKRNYTKNIYLFALALIIYWVILLIIYEKDKKIELVQVNDEELFQKYNPMVAGCLQGSRDILARDIIAVILNLIENKHINLEIKKINSESYGYYLTKVPEKENMMDEIETIIYNWVFEGANVVELAKRLGEIPKDKLANEKFERLNNITQKTLNQKGANKRTVPVLLRVFNTFLFFITIYVVIKHIMYEGFEIYNETDILFTIIPILLYMLPITMILIYIPIMIIVNIRHQVTKLVHKVTGQKVVTTSITIISIFLVIILLTVLIANKANRYIVADEILLCISLIIMLTDNLMLKNSVKMIEDYSKINGLKQKIENYTMMEDRDIEQVTLWGKYLAYSVSFGIADKICKRIKGLYVDDDLLNIINDKKMLDYIFSNYSFFYYNTSLDRRFMRGYTKAIGTVVSSYGSDSSSGGSGGGFSGGGGFSRGRRLSEEAGGAF
jgi:uncharacterized membrane protein